MSVKYDKQIETIKNKGAKAFKDGLTIDDCPYKVEGKQGRKFKRIWLAGYIDARDGAINIDIPNVSISSYITFDNNSIKVHNE